MAMLLLCGCPAEKKAEPVAAPVVREAVDAGAAAAAPAAQPEPEAPAPVEVKLTGSVEVKKLKAARLVLVVSKGRCAADSAELEVLEQTDVSAGPLLSEMSFPPDTVAHLCVLALDARGKLIGFAAHPGNPVTLSGQVELKALTLKPVKARPAPKGL
ncbi:MAG: hypothetical protein IPJ65_26970 [Archangiaceae bacterium]|nr:hypothetical protein [Archangiaceae bacterium]